MYGLMAMNISMLLPLPEVCTDACTPGSAGGVEHAELPSLHASFLYKTGPTTHEGLRTKF